MTLDHITPYCSCNDGSGLCIFSKADTEKPTIFQEFIKDQVVGAAIRRLLIPFIALKLHILLDNSCAGMLIYLFGTKNVINQSSLLAMYRIRRVLPLLSEAWFWCHLAIAILGFFDIPFLKPPQATAPSNTPLILTDAAKEGENIRSNPSASFVRRGLLTSLKNSNVPVRYVAIPIAFCLWHVLLFYGVIHLFTHSRPTPPKEVVFTPLFLETAFTTVWLHWSLYRLDSAIELKTWSLRPLFSAIGLENWSLHRMYSAIGLDTHK